MPSKYNENLGKKYPTPFTANPELSFSQLSELEKLKKMMRISEKDIANGIGNKETLMTNILAFRKRIAEIKSTIEKETLVQSSFESETIETTIVSHSPPKVEDKYKIEHVELKNSSTWKKIDFSGRTPYKPPNSGVLNVKKPWWKFW